MPFGLHLPELIIVLAVALLVFGPKKLPEMGSAIGKSIKEFRKGMNELSNPETKNNALKGPKEAVEEISQPLASEPVASALASSEGDLNIEKHSND